MEHILSNVHSEGRCCISFHPSSEYLCVGGHSGFIKQYSYGLSHGKLLLSNPMDSSSQYHDDPIIQIEYCSSGDYFALCCDDGEVVLFRHSDFTRHSLLAKYDCPVSSITFLHEAHSFLFAMSNDNGKIKIVNALDFYTKHFEFPCCENTGVRFIKFISYKPDPFRTSREKYLAVSQCDGNFTIWKISKQAIFDENIKDIQQKVVKTQEFANVFPKIKGGDVNQRLEFDETKNCDLIAIVGNKNIKILATKSMLFMNTDNMSHPSNTNCCVFNHFLESMEKNNYILASSDISGNIFIWTIIYGENTFKCEMIDKMCHNVAICNLAWRNKNELFISTTNANIYKYCLENNDNMNNNKENIFDNINEENKQEKETKKYESDHSNDDIDIDIDMNENETLSTKKIFRKRTFEDSESEKSQSITPKPLHTNTNTNNEKNTIAIANTNANTNNIPIANPQKSDALKADLAAAAEMFADDQSSEHDNDTIKQSKESSEAMDPNIDSVAEKEEEDILMKDTGEDLQDFIVNENENENENMNEQKEDENSKEIMDNNNNNMMDNMHNICIHEPFVNGSTVFDEDGQRYLLMNKIGAIIIRKQNMFANDMKINNNNYNIMNALHSGKYCVEIDFFDKSKYQRAVTIKTDHNFICADMNCYGLLLGSQPMNESMDDSINDSMVRYKPVLRNNEYRNFASEKDCEWNYVLPGDEICVAVALTFKYALIATNKRYLRILSVGGLQVHNIISLPKDVINICGDELNNNIAITFSDYSLWILDLDKNSEIYNGYCPVTNNECDIIRIFMVNNKLITIDSFNCVRLLCNNIFNNSWIVILDIDDYLNRKYPQNINNNNKKSIANLKPKNAWPIYFDFEEECLMVMELKFLDYPIPSESIGNNGYILTDYKLLMPLLNMNNPNNENHINPLTNEVIVMFGNREANIMSKCLVNEQFKQNKQNNNTKKQLLKEYITLFNYACKSNKQILAYDIALHFLDSEKALSNAIKISMHNQLPLLAEQLSNLAKKRIQKSSNNSNNINKNNRNNNPSIVKKPIRSFGKLKRPTVKLNGNRKMHQNNNRNNNNMNEMTQSMQRTQLIGRKRPNNPCKNTQSIQPPNKAQKRNPFSCNDNKRASTANYNDKKHNNSIFTV